ncbi:unannotated protein [freshwater metagenome]|uniref:Unannotated protein n=1 Tax=freshwater metagenome TaxID=449393 RepID=A0A6J6GSY0_9ZZZZ
MRRSDGNTAAHTPTTTSVPMPPPTTVAGVPIACAAMPLSNAPSSFEAPMNTFSTASTRPRFSSGVTSGTSELRMNTLTMSAALSTRIAAKATA